MSDATAHAEILNGPAGTRRTVRKANTRTTVVRAASRLFASRGYDAVTLRDVATAAGVSTGSIFSSFAGKAELYAAATGQPAPDVLGFLSHVEGLNVGPLSTAAASLRRQLVGA